MADLFRHLFMGYSDGEMTPYETLRLQTIVLQIGYIFSRPQVHTSDTCW